MVNHVYLDKSYAFDISLLCYYNNNCLYLLHQHFIDNEYSLNNFFTSCHLKRREIKNMPDYKALLV